MAPLIGITGRASTGTALGIRAPHLVDSPIDLFFAEYGQRLAGCGAAPVELPRIDDPQRYVDRIDGLVLTGGGDVDPALWGGPPETSFGVDRGRDDFEIALLDCAIERNIPVLAICRGIQLVNVALGGTLVPQLPWNEGDEHSRRRDDRVRPVHEVAFETGSIAHDLYGASTKVNSFHHQAIDQPGDGIEVTGRSPDGTIESAERGDLLLAVQWHPEMMQPVEPVFGWLVAAARRVQGD